MARTRPSPAASRGLRRVEETSAGGLVVDADADPQVAALIGRHDRRGRLLWSLPKGHLEGSESLEQAAVREVAEETGITGAIIAPLGIIDFWFVTEGKRVHKTVHHFLMRASTRELSDADPEVSEVAWVPLAEVPQRLSYADERGLIQGVSELLSGSA